MKYTLYLWEKFDEIVKELESMPLYSDIHEKRDINNLIKDYKLIKEQGLKIKALEDVSIWDSYITKNHSQLNKNILSI